MVYGGYSPRIELPYHPVTPPVDIGLKKRHRAIIYTSTFVSKGVISAKHISGPSETIHRETMA